jgi:predicted transcriptional regulator
MISLNEAAEKLGLSENTIRNMCHKNMFKGAYQTETGQWLIPEDNFITNQEQDKRTYELFRRLDEKNKRIGDIDEFDFY